MIQNLKYKFQQMDRRNRIQVLLIGVIGLFVLIALMLIVLITYIYPLGTPDWDRPCLDEEKEIITNALEDLDMDFWVDCVGSSVMGYVHYVDAQYGETVAEVYSRGWVSQGIEGTTRGGVREHEYAHNPNHPNVVARFRSSDQSIWFTKKHE